MLKFLGKGGAFNTNLGNTSAFYIENKNLYLFDCGEDVYQKLVQKKLLVNLDKIYVFITHLHSDHIGSLASLCSHVKNVIRSVDKLTIIYDEKENLIKLLELMGINCEQFKIVTTREISEFCVESLVQNHIAGSFGYIVDLGYRRIFYSGDASEVNKIALDQLLTNQLDYFYQEANLIKYRLHTSVEELEQAIPQEFRQKVYVMHLDEATEQSILEKGFQKVETI